MSTDRNIGIIILAAGQSSRIGYPKQLLLYSGQSFLQHTITVAERSNAGSITVVLGANADMIQDQIKSDRTQFIVNPAWKEGMASTIRYGLTTLVKTKPLIEAVLLLVADQPYVTSALLNDLMHLYKKNDNLIVASKYDDTYGTPVLFEKTFFPELIKLEGDVGAKKIIQEHINQAAFVFFPKGNIDIDTMDDYRNLTQE